MEENENEKRQMMLEQYTYVFDELIRNVTDLPATERRDAAIRSLRLSKEVVLDAVESTDEPFVGMI